MPIASAGNVITSSAQLGADVVLTGAIKDGEIVNADIGAAAAILGSKLQALSVGANAGVIPSTGIVNAHLSGTAGITDANLAQITTANKVHGSALTGLASIPAGAGVIPAANVPGSLAEAGTTVLKTGGAAGTTAAASYTKVKEFISGRSGTLRIDCNLHSSNGSTAVYYKVYVNGVAAGAEHTTTSGSDQNFSDDIAGINYGDLIQIYAYAAGGAATAVVNNTNYLKIKCDEWTENL